MLVSVSIPNTKAKLVLEVDMNMLDGCCGVTHIHDYSVYIHQEDGHVYPRVTRDMITNELREQLYDLMWKKIERDANNENRGLIILTDIDLDKHIEIEELDPVHYANDWRYGVSLYDFAMKSGFTKERTFFNPNSDNQVAVLTREVNQ